MGEFSLFILLKPFLIGHKGMFMLDECDLVSEKENDSLIELIRSVLVLITLVSSLMLQFMSLA